MSDDVFLDTNVLIYAVVPADHRYAAATDALRDGGVISIQVLNEFVSVARRKLRRDWPDIREALTYFSDALRPPRPISLETHRTALEIAEVHGVTIYDALVVASALEADCTVLLTEDLQDGRVFDGRLTIRNPFSAPSLPADPASGR